MRASTAVGDVVPNQVRGFVVKDGEGEEIRGPVGGPALIKARAETTNGAFTALVNAIAPGQGPPLHIHVREDEMYYVLGGQLRFKIGDQMLDAETGSFVFIPRGTEHCFQNAGSGPAQLLVMFAPAGMERFFEEHAKLPAGPVDAERYRLIAHGAWMEVVGPPLAESDPL